MKREREREREREAEEGEAIKWVLRKSGALLLHWTGLVFKISLCRKLKK
jgi:hypothetical protein